MKETFQIIVDDKTIDVVHEGKRALSAQSGGLETLTHIVHRALSNGETEGYEPYNNFECSVNWKVKDNSLYENIR